MERSPSLNARALFHQVAEKRGTLDGSLPAGHFRADSVSENRNLMQFFFSPYFSTDEKKGALDRAIEGGNPELSTSASL